ncbi:MAG: hypothetical protein IMY81_01660, partial [Chloroflexi bacterium]|nr:hypothetical protein [Chloroflexota bacterium]
GGLHTKFFSFVLLCLDAYIKGAALGYTFRDKYDLLVSMMVKRDKVREHTVYLSNIARKRIDSYNQEITSVIDFFISTELSKDKLTFDDFLRKAETKVKIEYMGPRIKLVFEEGTSFGSSYPEIANRIISLERRTSSLDWEKAKILGHTFHINNLELDLEFLKKWAIHNLGIYVKEYFPELVIPLQLEATLEGY